MPADGREGDPPRWPLARPSQREKALWAHLWALPQAVEWERCGLTTEVAMYTRQLALGEVPGSPVARSALAHRMADSLGLTAAGLRSNRWRVAARQEPAAVTPIDAVSSRDRLTGRLAGDGE